MCEDNDDSSTNKTPGKLLFQKNKKKKKIDVSKLLRLVWQWNDSDIRETLTPAVTKVLKDESNNDTMIQTRRAKALSILGEEFYTMGKKYSQNNKWQNNIVLLKRIRTTFGATILRNYHHQQKRGETSS